jgi:hypothetical protein
MNGVWRMKKASLMIMTMAVTIMIVISIIGLLICTQQNAANESILPGSEIQFTDKQVYLFGYSQNTGFIVDRLHLSTSNVTLVTSVSELSNLTGRYVLFIDGAAFLNSYNYSMIDTAKAVQPNILNGIPTILLNRSMDFFSFAVPDITFGYSQSNVDGRTIIPLTNGVKVVPGETSAAEWSLNGRDDQFGQLITAAYNWGVRNLDEPSP